MKRAIAGALIVSFLAPSVLFAVDGKGGAHNLRHRSVISSANSSIY
jgi:hypothetical protein